MKKQAYNKAVKALNSAKAKVAEDVKRIKAAERYLSKVAQQSYPNLYEVKLFSQKTGQELDAGFSPVIVYGDTLNAEQINEFLYSEFSDVLTYQVREISDSSGHDQDPAEIGAWTQYMYMNFEQNRLNHQV